jgi:hypothetical protein
MLKKQKTLLILLLLATVFKGIVWSAIIPMWQFPDEQEHFAQVQYYAELRHKINTVNDLSEEVAKSELLLGTFRDERGNNKFTYHPEYKIEYSNSMIGIFEDEIKNTPVSSRKIFVKKEAARYPPLFYILSSVGYLIAYPFNLFVRLALTRFISVIFAALTVWAAFLLAKSIFKKNLLLSLAVASMVSFQPMFSFLSSGVNNDNLLNLLSTLLLWLMIDAIRNGLTIKKSILMGGFLGLGIFTKQLIYPFIPLLLFLILYETLVKRKDFSSMLKMLFPFLISALLMGGVVFAGEWIQTGKLPYWPQVNAGSPRVNLSLAQYLSEKIPQLYRETLPWYWGVFKWLGVVLPLPILRAIKVVMALALLGLVKYAAQKFLTRKISVRDLQLTFLLFSSLWFIFILLIWDYMLIRSIGFSHGIQGRNFFSNIAGHMTLATFGFWSLSKNYRAYIVKAAVIAMIILNFLAIKRVLEIYYTFFPLSQLIIELSQYKPWFFKGIGLIIWFVLYISLLAQFISRYSSLKEKK